MTPHKLVATIVGISQRVMMTAVTAWPCGKRAICGTYHGASKAPASARTPRTPINSRISEDAKLSASSSRSVLT